VLVLVLVLLLMLLLLLLLLTRPPAFQFMMWTSSDTSKLGAAAMTLFAVPFVCAGFMTFMMALAAWSAMFPWLVPIIGTLLPCLPQQMMEVMQADDGPGGGGGGDGVHEQLQQHIADARVVLPVWYCACGSGAQQSGLFCFDCGAPSGGGGGGGQAAVLAVPSAPEQSLMPMDLAPLATTSSGTQVFAAEYSSIALNL